MASVVSTLFLLNDYRKTAVNRCVIRSAISKQLANIYFGLVLILPFLAAGAGSRLRLLEEPHTVCWDQPGGRPGTRFSELRDLTIYTDGEGCKSLHYNIYSSLPIWLLRMTESMPKVNIHGQSVTMYIFLQFQFVSGIIVGQRIRFAVATLQGFSGEPFTLLKFHSG